MIGVLCPEHEKSFAEEFFQLFKTPWEYLREGKPYDVVLCSDGTADVPAARLCLVFGGGEARVDPLLGVRVASLGDSGTVRFEAAGVPDVGAEVSVYAGISEVAVKPARRDARVLARVVGTGVPAAVAVGGESGTVVRFGFNLFAETALLLLRGQPSERAAVPVLDVQVSMLRRILLEHGIAFLEVPPAPAGHALTACLTHDVDFVGIRDHLLTKSFAGFLFRAVWGSVLRFARNDLDLRQVFRNWGAVLSLPLVLFGLRRDVWMQFSRYVEIEKELPSTFFFLPFRRLPGIFGSATAPAARAARYRLERLREVFSLLKAAGKEIGVHGIDSWACSVHAMRERRRIADAAETVPAGIRMHWLLFDGRSFANLDQCFSYDSTFGYNDTVGFRAGTTQAYVPPGAAELVEIPMIVQDTSLFYSRRMRLSRHQARELWLRVLSRYRTGGGVLTVSWHQRSPGPERLWGDFYGEMLADLREAGAWFGTAEAVARWFRMRRSLRFEAAAADGESPAYRIRYAGSDDLPPLRVGVWSPTGPDRDEGTSAGPYGRFVELLFDEEREVSLEMQG